MTYVCTQICVHAIHVWFSLRSIFHILAHVGALCLKLYHSNEIM
jgi:hypothetical protein